MSRNMSNSPLVSVIIPCFNGGATIGKTVKSVQDQTYANIETVVVNDGSTDNLTSKKINSFVNVKVINQENKGLPCARNIGAKAASGSYLLFLDADDWLETDAVFKMVAALERAKAPSFVCPTLILEHKRKGVLNKKFNFFEQLFLNQLPYSIMLPRTMWQSVGGFDEAMVRGYEDWDFNIRLSVAGYTCVVLDVPLLHYRVTTSGMLIAVSNRVHGELWSHIRSKHRDLYKPVSLFWIWLKYRKQPSTYPLWIYFLWNAFYICLPDRVVSGLFRVLRSMNVKFRKL